MRRLFSLRRLLPLLLVALPAGVLRAADASVAAGGGATLPAMWAGILFAGILTVALMLHLSVVVQENRMAPPSLASALDRTVGGGNYQEAWEMCRNRPGVYLAGIGGAALEQIGNGHVAVETARIASGARAARSVRIPLRCLFGVAVLATVLLAGNFLQARSGAGGMADVRAWTLRSGVAWVGVAGWFAVAVPAWVYFLVLRARAREWFAAANERIDAIMGRLPYEDLEGVRIGEVFSAGPDMSAVDDTGRRTLHVSRELTTHCPECNAPVRADAAVCTKCGAVLNWN